MTHEQFSGKIDFFDSDQFGEMLAQSLYSGWLTYLELVP